MNRSFAMWLLMSSCLSQAFAQVSTEPLSVPEEVMQKLLIHRVDPVLSAEPPMRLHGTVILKAIIDDSGNVINLQMVSGHPMLVPRAIDAVRQWKYRPYLLNGISVQVETTIRVEFRLPDSAQQRAIIEKTPDEAIQVPSETVQALIVRKVAPVYPPLARQARIQGPVVLSIIINKDGEVRDTKLVSGHPMLAPAAITAVKQWRYKPYLAGEEAVEVETVVRVNFELADGPDTGGQEGKQRDSRCCVSVPQFVRVPEQVMNRLLDKKVDPEYPTEVTEKHIEGTVVLNVNIDSEGNVARVELVSGHPQLAAAAMDAVLQWKYRPFILRGDAVPVESVVQVKLRSPE